MLPRTIFLSRLIGLFALIVSLSELAHKSAMVALATDLANAPPLLFIAGTFMLLGGLAIVLTHNIWGGGFAPVLVTLIGWVMLVRGVILVFISPEGAVGVFEALRFAEFYYVYAALPLLLGLYLTFAGFTAQQDGTVAPRSRP